MTKAEVLIVYQNCVIQAMLHIIIENMCEDDAEVLKKADEINEKAQALMEETMKNYDSTL